MGRGKNKRGKKSKNANKQAKSVTPAAPTPREDPVAKPREPSAAAEVERAEQAAQAVGLSPSPAATTPDEGLDELKRRCAGVAASYEEAIRVAQERAAEAEKREAEASRREAEAAEKTRSLADRESEFSKRQEHLEKRATQARDRERELIDRGKKLAGDRDVIRKEQRALERKREEVLGREESLAKREADADAGFLTSRELSLEELQRRRQELLNECSELAKNLENQRQEHTKRLLGREQAHREKLEKQAQAAEDELTKREQASRARVEELREREREVRLLQEELKQELEDVEDDRANIQRIFEKRLERQQEELERERSRLKEANEKLYDRYQALEGKFQEHLEAARALSNESPEALRKRLEQQAKMIQELEDELANCLPPGDAEVLTELRDEQSLWDNERRNLLHELKTKARKLEALQHEADQVEVLQERNRALQENIRLLREALDELRDDIDERLDKHRDQPVFPEFTRMDSDAGLSTSPAAIYRPTDGVLDLEVFANDLQHRIGVVDDPEQPDLFYRLEDIRALLGGLAMSRLHLLQGISGIGKSSLPRRFAAAVGGLCETVSVQAGWRDRNDLLGYFNTFERRYYESSFVQAVYKAQLPKYANLFVLILLDEMNLSHPEQYAADVLDVLERRERATRRFDLLSSRPAGPTPKMLQDGRYLPLPDNVWFVGTANHDETTKDFADKTYDRSFVLALPDRPERVELASKPYRDPVSAHRLRAAFDTACKKYSTSAAQGVRWLTEKLAPPMREFGIGFGGRLERQAERYIPVVRAAGGSLSEALDQMITTRLLRRLKGRHDLQEDDLRSLHQVLAGSWIEKDASPKAALDLLGKEFKRLGVEP